MLANISLRTLSGCHNLSLSLQPKESGLDGMSMQAINMAFQVINFVSRPHMDMRFSMFQEEFYFLKVARLILKKGSSSFITIGGWDLSHCLCLRMIAKGGRSIKDTAEDCIF